MEDSEFGRIIHFIYNNYGINLTQKRVLVEGRLEHYLMRNGFCSVSEYMNIVESNRAGAEAEELINLLTTNHTYFMREAEHFTFLRNKVLPWIKQKEQIGKDLRIWSAAASSGEEPYTIAMVINDFFALDLHEWETTILATDISTEVLEHAVRGCYMESQLKGLPEAWRRRYFSPIDSERYRISDALKGQVLFRQFNLMNPLPFQHKFHAVFLRNVMIYFDKKTKDELLEKISRALEPGGYLFIGVTETLERGRFGLEYIQPAIYRKGVQRGGDMKRI